LPRSRGFGPPRGRTSNRRRTGWEEGPFSTTLSVSSATSLLWTTGQIAIDDGATIARIRGSIAVQLQTAASAGDGFQAVGIGIGIVSLPAFNAGVASVPTPLTEIEWEGWLWHHLITGLVSPSTTPTWGDAGGTVRNIEIDSKAMRKFNSQEVIYGAIEFSGEIGAATAEVHARTRLLLFLP